MTEEQISQLKLKLEELHKWPDIYMFKFIIPVDEAKKHKVVSTFSETAEIRFKESSKGTYTSVTIKERCPSAEYVVDKYVQLKDVEGLISL